MTQPLASDVFFLRRDVGQRFCVHHAPSSSAAPVRAVLLYVHPFGEELNKSRRMAALQARALAQANCAVLQIDLLGCGDSSGLLCDATWAAWIDDVKAACAWLTERYPDAPLWLWGLRAGSLLAAEVAAELDRPANLLLWQPIVAGKTQIQQFLRLKATGNLSDGASAQATMSALREALGSGQTVDIAGYPLPAGLALSMESAELRAPRQGCRVRWLEVSTRPETGVAAASLKTLEAWQAAASDVESRVLSGSAFWQATEIEEAPALLQASIDAVCTVGGDGP
jgi:uncharacterized protein